MAKKRIQEIFVLLADGDGTTRSTDTPFGVAVKTEEEAKRFCKLGGVGYTHSYEKVRVFDNFEDGVAWAFGKGGPQSIEGFDDEC